MLHHIICFSWPFCVHVDESINAGMLQDESSMFIVFDQTHIRMRIAGICTCYSKPTDIQ